MYDNEYILLLDDDLFFVDDEDNLIHELLEDVHNGLSILQSESCPS